MLVNRYLLILPNKAAEMTKYNLVTYRPTYTKINTYTYVAAL